MITTPGNITQHTLLGYLLGNHDVWPIVEPIIKPEYFADEFKPVVRLMLEHVDQYKILPSLPIILMKTGKQLEQYEDAADPRNTDWLINEVEEFCRHSATLLEIQRAYEVVSKDSSREALEEIFQNIKKITEINVNKDLGIEMHEDAMKQLEKPLNVIKKYCGYQHLDRVIGGGFPTPGMVLISGKSGYGKSVNLANLGIQYCEQGEFVVYITLEMDQDRIFDRVSSMMTDVPARRIRTEKIQVGNKLEYRMQNGDGYYCIKKFPISGTTTSHINGYLKELTIKKGKKPTVLIVDYINLLYPKAKIRDMGAIHIKDKYCAEELYGLAEEWKVLCITASQFVKDSDDHNMFDHAIVAGGTPLINTSDYVLTFNRKDNIVWFNIIKGRDGGAGISVPLYTDVETLRLSDAPDELFYERNPKFNPNYKINEIRKADSLEKKSINKDMQSYQNDDILGKIMNMNNALVEDE